MVRIDEDATSSGAGCSLQRLSHLRVKKAKKGKTAYRNKSCNMLASDVSLRRSNNNCQVKGFDSMVQHASGKTSKRSMIAQCDRDESIAVHLRETAAVLEETAMHCRETIQHAAQLIADCFHTGGKLLLCGNGGSAAECQHMAAELAHRLSANVMRRALPALSLTTDTSFLTACSNDDGFDYVFARQVEALGRADDVLLGLSTSGNSANVVAAFRQARSQGLRLIALCGTAGEMASLADIAITIPATSTQAIQEAHLPIIHILCDLIEQQFV